MRKQVDNVNHDRRAAQLEGRDVPDVLELVHALMHDYRSLQYRFLRDGPHEITHMDGKVLAFFGRRPGASQSDLAQQSGRDKAQLARLIKGLRERGLLQAEADEADRRTVRLSLTAEGQAVHRALALQARRLAGQAVAGLTAAERAQLAALLQRMRTNLAG